MNNENPPEKKLESPILRKQSTPFTDEVQRLHAELASVFGDIGEPVLYVDNALPVSSTDNKTPTPHADAQLSSGATGFGGEADLVLINAHIPDNTNDEKIDFKNFMEEPTTPCLVVKVQDFGDKIIEVVAYKQFEKRRPPKKGTKKISKTRDEMIPEQLAASVQRAKTQIRHKCIAIRADRMLTTTYRENMCDRDQAYRDHEKFIKLCRKQFGEFPYVAVAEMQKRGAIHIHMALNKYYPINILRKLWHQAIGEREDGLSPGNVDIQKKSSYVQGGKSSKKKITIIARYMSKYLAKDIDGQEIGKKRYSSSRGIPKPDVRLYYLPLGDNTFRLIGDIVLQENGAMVGNFLEFDNLIWCSTYT